MSTDELPVWALLHTYLASNDGRFQLLRRNLQFVGPYPPQSLFMFLIHSTQTAALMELKEHFEIPNPSEEGQGKRTYDPYATYPYPVIMTAEILGKVALLKALQREYQFRLGDVWNRRIFYRTSYFLALQLPIGTSIPCECKSCRDRLIELSQEPEKEGETIVHKGTQRDLRGALNRCLGHPRYNALTFPLIWGPYTGVELMEIRANLIVQENSFRKMDLSEHRAIHEAFLNAAVLGVGKPGNRISKSCRQILELEDNSFCLPIHYRMAQPFASIDASGNKSLEFEPNRFLEDMGRPSTVLRSTEVTNLFHFHQHSGRCLTLLKDITDPLDFAYKSNFDKLRS